jgi:hypothetical protein
MLVNHIQLILKEILAILTILKETVYKITFQFM